MVGEWQRPNLLGGHPIMKDFGVNAATAGPDMPMGCQPLQHRWILQVGEEGCYRAKRSHCLVKSVLKY